MPPDEFEQLVTAHYEPLYRFALSLTRTEADACDLTQQTFFIWATKGHQLRDPSKVKSWLFTTLHREFLKIRKRAVNSPHFELSDVIDDLPAATPEVVNTLDAARLLEFLGQVLEPCRAALSLFYLEDYSYKEIAEILGIPLGTVRSRLSRGIAQLRHSILEGTDTTSRRTMPALDTVDPRWLKLGEPPVAGGNASFQPAGFTGILARRARTGGRMPPQTAGKDSCTAATVRGVGHS